MVLTMPEIPPLTRFYVYVTNACNCTCKHCWIMPVIEPGRSEERKVNHLPVELFEAAVEEAKPLGLSSVKWTGGEPTVHPDFQRLLEVQKKNGLVGQVETNGMEVTSALARLMAESGVTHVAVSLDGTVAETHDAVRGVQGAYGRALKGIRNLAEAGFNPQIIMTLMRENVKQMEELLELAQKLGAGSVKFNPVQPTLRGEVLHDQNQALSVREIISLNQTVEKKLMKVYPLPIFFDIPMAFKSLRHILEGDGCSVCGVKTLLGVLADGQYALCGIGENVPELCFGRVAKSELNDVWSQNPVLGRIRSGLPEDLKGVCRGCVMKARCLGHCIAQNYYRNGDLFSANWFCELAVTESLFPTTRSMP